MEGKKDIFRIWIWKCEALRNRVRMLQRFLALNLALGQDDHILSCHMKHQLGCKHHGWSSTAQHNAKAWHDVKKSVEGRNISSSNWKWPHCGSMGRTQTIQTDISLITLITHTHTWLLNTHTYHTQIFRYFITFLCAVQELNLYLLNIQNGMQMQQLCFLVFQSKVCLWTMCTAGSGPGWPAVSELSYISQRTQRFPGVSCYSRTGCTLL